MTDMRAAQRVGRWRIVLWLAVMALATTVPGYLIWFAVQPWPAGLVAKQITFSTLAMLLLGLLLAWLQPRRVSL